jgi:hypothetical protein
MEVILAPAREFGLHIFTRVPGDDPAFAWPAEYREHIVGSLPYERILAAYKAYKVFLSVSSVTDSATMCARRLFELCACGTPVLSGYSRAIEAAFGDLVPVSTTAAETAAKLEEMLSDPQASADRAQLAMREVFSKHTYGQRVDQVLRAVGLPVADRAPTVSALSVVDDDGDAPELITAIAAQSWRPREFVVVGRGAALEGVEDRARRAGIERVITRQAPDGAPRGSCLNLGLGAVEGELVALFDPACAYEEHYLTDLVHAFSYTDAGVVGKPPRSAAPEPNGAGGRFTESEHRYVDEVEAASIVVAAETLKRLRFNDASRDAEHDLLSRCGRAGVRIFAADRFSFRRAPISRDRTTALG